MEKYSLFNEEKYNIKISNSKKNRLLEFIRNTNASIDDILKELNIENNIGRK